MLMQSIRQHIIFRLIWLLMAVHIFNCSVDTPDAKPDYIPEDLSYNDMESVVEIILEDFLEIKDALAEHDENDTEDGCSFDLKKQLVYFYQLNFRSNKKNHNGLIKLALTEYKEQYISPFHPEILPPPPKS